MNPVKAFLFFSLVLMCASATSQDYNPYKSIGKKGKVVTVYKNEYVGENKTVIRIGSVLINTKTNKIARLLNSDSLSKKSADNTTNSRWYQVDPKAEKYLSISPYAGMGNNPIFYMDIDGREIVPGANWTGSVYASTYSQLANLSSFKQLTQRFEGSSERNVYLNVQGNDPLGTSYGRTNSYATHTRYAGTDEFYVSGEHDMNFYSNVSMQLNGANLNSLGQAATITHEFLHANSYYEVDNNTIRYDWGGEATLAHGGYLGKMQSVLKDFVTRTI